MRNAIKWTGTLACVLLLGTWLVSCWSAMGYIHSGRSFAVLSGYCFAGLSTTGGSNEGWYFDLFSPEYLSVLTIQDRVLGEWKYESTPTSFAISVPLWVPFLIMVLPTTYAWFVDVLATRRIRTEHCPRCSYDLRGLYPGTTCPECNSTKQA